MPVYNWNDFGINQITNFYLYGAIDKPAALLDDARIRSSVSLTDPTESFTASITMDAVSFMADGPGRFAKASLSAFVGGFFQSNNPAFQATGQRHEFHKADIASTLGYIDIFGNLNTSAGDIRFQAYNYDDGRHGPDDYLLRSYMYNSESFKLSDNVVFVVEADGTKHIENLKFIPFNDNLDFESNDPFAVIVNGYLQPQIDPSNMFEPIISLLAVQEINEKLIL